MTPLVESRSITTAPGASSVMTTETSMMPEWCAGSWDLRTLTAPLCLLTPDREKVRGCAYGT